MAFLQEKGVQAKSTAALRKAAFFALVLGTCVVPSQGFATEEAPVVETGPVVVSATRTERYLEDVSASMEVFTAEDIKKLGANNVMQVLATAQNVNVGFKLGVRGMPSEGTTILINGRKPAGELHVGSGANRTVQAIDINRIERIEILAGPSSALYGSATGGVINIITKKSTEPSVTAGLSGGNYKIRNYYSVDSGAIDKFDFLANVGYTSNIPVKDKMNDNVGTPWTEYSGSRDGDEWAGDVTLGYNFNDDHRLTFYGDYFHETYSSDSVSSSYDKTTGLYTRKYSESDQTDIQRYGASLVYDGVVGDHIYSLSATYTVMEEYWESDKSHDLYTDLTLEAQDTWIINEYHTLTFGGQYKAQVTDAPGRATNGDETSFALYIQDEISLFDDTLLITPALRLDHYESWGAHVSPKLGVVWKFLEDHRLKANFGLGFRAPGIDELYRKDLHTANTTKNRNSYGYFGNENLKPEESVSWDVRYEGEYENINWGITYYWNEITNLIQGWTWVPSTQYAGRDGYYTFGQIGKARTQGIEANIGIDFLDYFRASASYTYLDARDVETGEYINNNIMNTWQGMLEFSHPDWGTSAAVWMEITDHGYQNDMWIHGNTINASIRQTFAENYTIYASATNIFNNINDAKDNFMDAPEWNVGIEIKF